jgi:hypothetical protein
LNETLKVDGGIGPERAEHSPGAAQAPPYWFGVEGYDFIYKRIALQERQPHWPRDPKQARLRKTQFQAGRCW